MSLTRITKSAQCVSVKSSVYKPILLPKTQCPIHRSRVNCRVISTYEHKLTEQRTKIYLHATELENCYLNYRYQPYFFELLDESDINYSASYNNCDRSICVVLLPNEASKPIYFGLDKSGEKDLRVIEMVTYHIMMYMRNTTNILLMADDQYIDLVYNNTSVVLLPQAMTIIYVNDVPETDTEEMHEYKLGTSPNTHVFNFNHIMYSEDAMTCQKIYRSFLVYNTIMSMLLKQHNPFISTSKTISQIIRTLGVCPANKNMIKCCDLDYGGAAPGHVMCAPKKMIIRLFKYAKWGKNPINYKRYYELLTKSENRKQMRLADDTRRQVTSNHPLNVILEWHNFIMSFYRFFLRQQFRIFFPEGS